MTQRFSVKQIAEILSRSTSYAADRISRQIRYWTQQRVLPPDGDLHTGTGISRQYGEDKVYHAAVLQELAAIGVNPMPLLALAESLGDLYENPAWAAAKEGSGEVFLTGIFSRNGAEWHIDIGAPRTPTANSIPSDKAMRGLAQQFQPTSAVVLNLTTIFSGISFDEFESIDPLDISHVDD